MERTPSISVLMPVHNAEPFVRAAVESILAQSFGDFELLLVDDGSTDQSRHVLESLAAQDRRITFVSRANMGLVGTLNEMLVQARGEVVARMDADDVALPARFTLQWQFLERHREVGAVGGQVELIDPEGAALLKWELPCEHAEIDAALMRGTGGVIVHPAVMVRTESLRRIGGYREDLWPAEDLDLFLRLAEITRLANVPQTVLKYRQHLAGTGYRHRVKQKERMGCAVRDAMSRRGMVAGDQGMMKEERGPVDAHGKWAWWALGSGEIATARKHAWRCWAARPWRMDNWRVLACCLRGY